MSFVEAHTGAGSNPPRLSALFLAKFDKKIGYTVAWKRSAIDIPIVPLDGAVEFKSLPSGLHAVKDDLVYFVHEGHAGLSAFCNAPASAAERNATFVSVGILVPLNQGRLGRSWLHAERLQSLASALAKDPENTAPLEDFWREQSQHTDSTSTQLSPDQQRGYRRRRALSTLTAALPPDQSLPEFHPARSIVHYVDVFGPLVFRLQEAALLRKRILFVGAPPVRASCEFVYNLSILASLPNAAREHLPSGSDHLSRFRALFCLGTHDIPLIEKLQREDQGQHPHSIEFPSPGWVSCSTDEIMAAKRQLYDVIVEIPHSYDAPPEQRRWPTIRTSDGTQVKASQRDVQRYKLLHHELWKYRHNVSDATGESGLEDDTRPLVRKDSEEAEEEFNETYDESAVEPMTWSRLAYLGFMWWASAGERDAYTTEERETDRELLGHLSDYQDGIHTAVIAAFHRWTVILFKHVARLLDAAESERGSPISELVIDREELSKMGLDTWSETDRVFIQDLVWLYFGVRADVQGAALECCGVRIPVC
ncbi:uncharacterized protein EI97DRAFT_476831 [Westerdykella ornata]|uniref:DUF4484 domain-containing protein n=1 Tax=Westerdykella ornata TaxID=318751 RepID=A0A6A6JEB9_WESOR|nr:uncharacterized protein EI97DRAFT_476831 [Westerdykella ornata]KAF2274762.1 hypothetical protein EI97DRAFT_476831 [Westerdykella ornata]